ncbi:GNAT family N-acetyltransferase [Croceibacterium ferulae]|uniref:GNAT family N-acetyltransferase n=1 Tax=Croceibacterium ferulae TaxID=1854641 RepID=UPI001F4D84A8|nr:GNAT family N-acetyltransferase [Croceibacterium ferulae]
MPSDPAIRLKALGPQDLPAALEIQAGAYPAFMVEDAPAFLSRITLAASYCLAAWRGGEMLGYLLAHGWKRQSPPAVGAVLKDGTPGEVLYLHDLAVAAAGRDLRIGRQLVTRAFAMAAQDGLRSAELIAVEGAADYWRRLGFAERAVADDLKARIMTYGSQARFMTAPIPPQG